MTKELQGELIASLEETMRTLAFVVFLSIKNHPDHEVVDNIQQVLARARTTLKIAKESKV